MAKSVVVHSVQQKKNDGRGESTRYILAALSLKNTCHIYAIVL